MNLVKQEIWVMLKKKTTCLALVVAVLGTIFTAYLAINQNRMLVDGAFLQGKQVVVFKQQEQKKIEGSVTQEKIQELLTNLYLINQMTPMTFDEKINFLNTKDYIEYEPYVNLLLDIYGAEKDYAIGYTKLYEIGIQAQDIYQDWKEKIQSNMMGAEKEDLRQILKNLPIPFTYEAGEFIPCAIAKFQDLMLLLYIVITIILASVFSRDRYTKTDQIILATKLGTRKLRKAKCTASVIFSSVVFIGCVLLYSGIIASQIGIQGLSSGIQMSIVQLSPYPLTALQAYACMILLAFVMCLCITMLVLFASNYTKRTYTVILVAFIVLFVFYMLNNANDTSSKLLMFLPFGLIDIHRIFRYCNVVVSSVSIWFPWLVTCVLLLLSFVLHNRIVHRS